MHKRRRTGRRIESVPTDTPKEAAAPPGCHPDGAPQSAQEAARRLALDCPDLVDATSLPQHSASDHLPAGRESEYRQLRTLLDALATDRLASSSCSSSSSVTIYVCGLPGSGKTYVVEAVASALAHRIQFVRLNCASITDNKQMLSTLIDRVDVNARKPASRSVEPSWSTLRRRIESHPRPVCFLLDEIDLLLSCTTRSLLVYSLFEMPRTCPQRCAMVGIANALDLPERMLPWLRLADCMPQVVCFAPYTAAQLVAIVRQRLGTDHSTAVASSVPQPWLSEAAIELAARKVATAYGGDMRVMLDACRNVLLASADSSDASAPATPGTQLAHMARTLADKGGVSAAVDAIRSLPLQQQLVLCALVGDAAAFVGGGGIHRTDTLARLHAHLTRLCKRMRLPPVQPSTLFEMCSTSLAHHGLVQVRAAVARGRGAHRIAPTHTARVRLCVPPDDVHHALHGISFFKTLLPSR